MSQTVNHFPVIASRDSGEREQLVVCDRGESFTDRYVTWRVFSRDDGQKVVTGGYYTGDLIKAVTDMNTR